MTKNEAPNRAPEEPAPHPRPAEAPLNLITFENLDLSGPRSPAARICVNGSAVGTMQAFYYWPNMQAFYVGPDRDVAEIVVEVFGHRRRFWPNGNVTAAVEEAKAFATAQIQEELNKPRWRLPWAML